MIEDIQMSRKSSQRRGQKASLASLLGLVLIVSTCLLGSAEAATGRKSRVLNSEQAFDELRQKYENEFYRVTHNNDEENLESPVVGQGDSYDDFYKPQDPFSTTENFLKFNSFIIGMKLTDTYGENTDLCINDLVHAVDTRAYFNNNITLHRKEMESKLHDTLFLPYLNFTGAIFGPIADSLPSCYAFVYDVYEYENSRFMTFESSWGNFFLAFLFNQMGNALNFQTKFERIQDERDRQNFAGVWQEYGDLVYLIITFQPIEEASLEGVESLVLKWMSDHEWLGDEDNDYQITDTHRTVVKTGVSTFANFVYSAGEAFGATVAAFKGAFEAKMAAKKQKYEFEQQQEQSLMMVEEGHGATVKQTVAESDYGQFLNGVFTGIVEVFPYESNQVRCKTNFTQGYDAGVRMSQYSAWAFSDATFQSNFVTDLSYILKLPFGISHSCYWGFSTVLINEDPMADGKMSQEEELEELIMINNHIFTNLFFNLGYIYQDIESMYELLCLAGMRTGTDLSGTACPAAASATALNYSNFGIYVGDILIRFFWRRRFTRNFEYQ